MTCADSEQGNELARVCEALGNFVGTCSDNSEVGEMCLEAVEPHLADALIDHADLFDFDAYAAKAKNEGHAYTIHVDNMILLFIF